MLSVDIIAPYRVGNVVVFIRRVMKRIDVLYSGHQDINKVECVSGHAQPFYAATKYLHATHSVVSLK